MIFGGSSLLDPHQSWEWRQHSATLMVHPLLTFPGTSSLTTTQLCKELEWSSAAIPGQPCLSFILRISGGPKSQNLTMIKWLNVLTICHMPKVGIPHCTFTLHYIYLYALQWNVIISSYKKTIRYVSRSKSPDIRATQTKADYWHMLTRDFLALMYKSWIIQGKLKELHCSLLSVNWT